LQEYRSISHSKRVAPIDSLDIVEEARDNEAKLDRSWTLDWAALRHRVTIPGLRNSDVVAIVRPVQPRPGTAPFVVGFSRVAMLTSRVSHEPTFQRQSRDRHRRRLGYWPGRRRTLLQGRSVGLRRRPQSGDLRTAPASCGALAPAFL